MTDVRRIILLLLSGLLLTGQVLAKNVSAGAGEWLYEQYEAELYGFIEGRQGWRLQNDPREDDETISEARLQLDLSKEFEWGIAKVKGDIVADRVLEEVSGEVRELNLALSPADAVDIKIGRQIQTWGTGDLLFINDLFPKDWESFFAGRDDEYLKTPSDSIRASVFFDRFTLDIAYSPLFNGSVYIDGERLSYWNGSRLAGKDSTFEDISRNDIFSDDELSIRLSKTIGGLELALYGYEGFWQTPEGIDPSSGKGFYPRLRAAGGSIRTAVLGGIGSIEAGYYDSYQDSSGTDPLIRNSEVRLLAGFEQDLARDFSGGVQYYLEAMRDYSAYRASFPFGAAAKDEHRHVLTLRLTRLLMNQNLKLSFFAYYSPSDRDAYLRPKAHYKVTDQWSLETGGNIFFGKDDHTFFAQFENNTNLYGGTRYSF